MAKKKKEPQAQDQPFSSLQVGDHFQWSQHPDIFQVLALTGANNVSIVAGPRQGQSFHFAEWERVRPVADPLASPTEGD